MGIAQRLPHPLTQWGPRRRTLALGGHRTGGMGMGIALHNVCPIHSHSGGLRRRTLALGGHWASHNITSAPSTHTVGASAPHPGAGRTLDKGHATRARCGGITQRQQGKGYGALGNMCTGYITSAPATLCEPQMRASNANGSLGNLYSM
ncbi:hypothetical protein FIBSPDRAFT_985741 [Athelia psychrophila]|uniref:Uncharacterized protein n=1 Tax=Athelia psychrophila TaxID=1759441 RepID=A0A166B2S1_9AGAM|nr:hypothetical protein FIBSPDRAFT_985741 [Fibularhizoctonia sp. CBS 109695]